MHYTKFFIPKASFSCTFINKLKQILMQSFTQLAAIELQTDFCKQASLRFYFVDDWDLLKFLSATPYNVCISSSFLTVINIVLALFANQQCLNINSYLKLNHAYITSQLIKIEDVFNRLVKVIIQRKIMWLSLTKRI